MVDEAELLQRLRNREQNAINEAIELYTPYLSTVLYHLAGATLPREDAEEIVADAFVILWKNAEYIDLQKGTLRSYLAAVARNAGIKRLKKGGSMCLLMTLRCRIQGILRRRVLITILSGML